MFALRCFVLTQDFPPLSAEQCPLPRYALFPPRALFPKARKQQFRTVFPLFLESSLVTVRKRNKPHAQQHCRIQKTHSSAFAHSSKLPSRSHSVLYGYVDLRECEEGTEKKGVAIERGEEGTEGGVHCSDTVGEEHRGNSLNRVLSHPARLSNSTPPVCIPRATASSPRAKLLPHPTSIYCNLSLCGHSDKAY